MHIRKAKLPPDILKIIHLYREMSVAEIRKINVQWACGVNKKHLFNTTLRTSHGYRMYYVETKKLIDLAEFGEMSRAKLDPHQLFSGIDERDFRVAMTLDHWSKGDYIDPPEICTDNSEKITFADGRHRTIAAFHIGESDIPVFIHSSLLKRISALIELK